MIQNIPKNNCKHANIDKVHCLAINIYAQPSITIGLGGPFRLELYTREDIQKLKDLCDFALTAEEYDKNRSLEEQLK
jgi:hypothetical protein